MERQVKPHRSLVGILLAALLGACSSEKPEPAEPAEPVDPSACNNLVDNGPKVGVTVFADPGPTATGGIIAEGTYELTQVNAFNPPAGYSNTSMLSAVFQFSATTIQQVGHIDGVESRYTSTYTTQETSISTTDTCPEPSLGAYSYTATPTELRFTSRPNGFRLEQVFTKR